MEECEKDCKSLDQGNTSKCQSQQHMKCLKDYECNLDGDNNCKSWNECSDKKKKS